MEFAVKEFLGKKMISVTTLADVLEIPVEVVRWHICSQADEDGISKGTYWCANGKQYYLTTACVLWLVDKLQYKKFPIVSEIVETMVKQAVKGEPDGVAAQKLADAVAKLSEVQEALKLSQETVDSLVTGIVGGAKTEAKKKRRSSSYGDALPKLTDEQKEWIGKVRAVANQKGKMVGLPGGKLYAIAYKVLRDRYGVVLSQTKKDFFYDNNIPMETEIRPIDLIAYHDDLRSLLWGVMGNIEEYVGDGNKKAS